MYSTPYSLYLRLVEKFQLLDMAGIGTGFNELVPQQLLKSFDERELELVIGGLVTIDLEDWRTNTRLKHCQLDTPQVP
jgi:hypothetical protein